MNIILAVIGISCFAVLFAEASGIMQWIKFKTVLVRIKPIDCPLCLSWWIGLIYFGYHLQSIEAVFYAATCSILSITISNYLRK